MVVYFPADAYKLASPRGEVAGSAYDGALLDTNILIDFLKGKEDAILVFENFNGLFTSAISYMEVMVGLQTPEEEASAAVMFSTV